MWLEGGGTSKANECWESYTCSEAAWCFPELWNGDSANASMPAKSCFGELGWF